LESRAFRLSCRTDLCPLPLPQPLAPVASLAGRLCPDAYSPRSVSANFASRKFTPTSAIPFPMKNFLLLLFASLLLMVRASAQTATATPNPTTYAAGGGQVTFTVAVTFPTTASSASFSIKPPTNTWVYLSTAGTSVPQVLPNANDTTTPGDAQSVFGWAYSDLTVLGTGAASYTFTLSYPAGLTGTQTFGLAADYRVGGVLTPITIPALVIEPTPVPPSITSHPSNATIASGANTSFSVVAAGIPTPTLKWQRSIDNGTTWADLSNDSTFGGVTTATLAVTAATNAMNGHKFRTIATNGNAPDAVSNPATLTVTFAPAIVTHPRTQAVSAGGTVVLNVVATGSPAPSYQWKKGATNLANDARISGATTASLTISGLIGADAGSYTVVVSNGVGAAVTSNAAALSVVTIGSFSATHSLVGAGYTPGGALTVTNTINYTGELASLSWSVLLPAGWSFASAVNAGSPSTQPSVNDILVLDWAWAVAPASGSSFTYTLNIPANAAGNQSLTSLVEFGVGVTPLQMVATPDPLPVNQIFFHTADTNGNNKVDLSELTRVITLYNTRFDTGAGKVRTGCYKIQSGTVDGFSTEITRDPSAVVTLPVYHAADYNRNGKIDLAELTRVITLYNTRFDTGSGKVRTGYYKVAVGVTTVDGYTTDPTRAP
jgi:hypothetical protein